MRHRPRPSLWDALQEYQWFLEQAPLAQASKVDYYYFAQAFVRWLEGEFKPGEHVDGTRLPLRRRP